MSEQEKEQQQGDTPGHGSGQSGLDDPGGTDPEHPGRTDQSETDDQDQPTRQGEVEREGDLGRESEQPAEDQQVS